MERDIPDDMKSPYAKYKTFKRAFDTINILADSGNLIGSFVLSFSVLEDRLCAALVVCSKALNHELTHKDLMKVPFLRRAKQLLAIGAIDEELYKKLQEAADLRNDLTHKMMWRLDVFKMEHIKNFRKLINDLAKVQRKHDKLIKGQT